MHSFSFSYGGTKPPTWSKEHLLGNPLNSPVLRAVHILAWRLTRPGFGPFCWEKKKRFRPTRTESFTSDRTSRERTTPFRPGYVFVPSSILHIFIPHSTRRRPMKAAVLRSASRHWHDRDRAAAVDTSTRWQLQHSISMIFETTFAAEVGDNDALIMSGRCADTATRGN